MTIVVVASRYDAAARNLVQRWSGHDAHLVTCDALSEPGWIFEPGQVERACWMLDGRSVAASNVRGVLTRLRCVTADELSRIAWPDREYVASEMMAFWVAWLAAQPCRVLNGPSPRDLAGPGFQREVWLATAEELGIAVMPWCRKVGHVGLADNPAATAEGRGTRDESPLDQTALSFVCGRIVVAGTRLVPEHLHHAAQRLAAYTRCDVLTLTFSKAGERWLLEDVAPLVDVSDARVADALLEVFLGGAA